MDNIFFWGSWEPHYFSRIVIFESVNAKTHPGQVLGVGFEQSIRIALGVAQY